MSKVKRCVKFRLLPSLAVMLMAAVMTVGMAVSVWATTTSVVWDKKEDFEPPSRINIDLTSVPDWVKFGLTKDVVSRGEMTCTGSDKIYTIGAERTSVAVIDVSSKALLRTIALPGKASGMVFNPQDNKLYVGNYDSSTVSVIIDGATAAISTTVNVGSGAFPAAYNSVNNKVYVANASDSTVSIINGTSDVVIATVPVIAGPSAAIYDAAKNQIYVTNKYNHTVSIIDGASDQVVAAVSIEPAVGIIGGQAPGNIGLRADTAALGVVVCDKMRLSWKYAPLQPSQKIQLQVRTAPDLPSLDAAEYVGPDGTSNTWYETPADGSDTASVDLAISFRRYVELQVKLSSDETASPALDWVRLDFISNPDLIMTAVSGPSTGLIGKAITVSSTVSNQGSEPAGPFDVRLDFADVNGTGSQHLLCNRSIASLAPGASDAADITCTIPNTVPPGTYYLQGTADDANQVVELSDSNNRMLGNSITLIQPYPDLIMTGVDGPDNGIVGSPITVSNAAKNQGNDSAGTFKVKMYLVDAVYRADNPSGIRDFPCERTINSLAEYGTDAATQSCTVPPVPAGDYYLRAVADADNAVNEGNNENNNAITGPRIITISPPDPDLVVQSVTGTVSNGKLYYTVVVKNLGISSTAGFYTGIYLSSDNVITGGINGQPNVDPFVYYVHCNGVAGGGTATLSGSYNVPNNLTGDYYVGAYADYNYGVPGPSTLDNIAEYNQNNNTLAGNQVTITNDLVVESVTGTVAGGKLSYTIKVRNNGNGQTGSFYTGIYLSPDATIIPGANGDTYVYYVSSGSVPGGGVVTLYGTPNVPSNFTGTYYVGAYADSNYNVPGVSGTDKVVEFNAEDNNGLAGSQVTITNDLVIVPGSLSGSVANGKLTYSLTVKNNGNGQSGSFYTGVYLTTDQAVTPGANNDRFVGYSSNAGLAGDGTALLTASPNLPTGVTGTYYVGAYADSNYNVGVSGADKVVELYEDNNTYVGNQVNIP